MEEIAMNMLVDGAKTITKMVAARASEEIKLAWGFEDQYKKFKERLLYVAAMMEDLAKRKHEEESKVVKLWLHDVKDVASSAENLLDDYQYEMLRREIELKPSCSSLKKTCSNYVKPSTNPIVFRNRMAHRVNQILSDLVELEERAIKLGLQQAQLAREAVSGGSTSGGHTRPRDQQIFELRKHAGARGSHHQFIGRQRDEDKLLKMILNPSTDKEDDPSIIAIVGIGGLGKTTLARHLYNHEEVNRQFRNTKFWICVSTDFSIDRILDEMVQKLKLMGCELTNTDAIIEKINKALKGKKFFLVLDDVWEKNKERWNSLKTELQGIEGLARSVILITTRIPEVAEKAHASCLYNLEGLSEQDGCDLLKQELDGTTPSDSSFVDVVKRIVVEKCKGVPLAIKSIGCLLQSNQDVSFWESIESSELWKMEQGDENYIMPSLLLSYNNIDHVCVKQCFAYCAIFPKDRVMGKGELIALWLAQGFIHDDIETINSFEIKETITGEKCFDALVKYSFLEEEDNGYETGYKMHDLVHDLATYVLEKDLLVWKGGNKPHETLNEDRMQKLRTISFWHGRQSWNFLNCGRYVRTLVIAEVGLAKVPPVIGQLVHLRYLDLSKNEGIDSLPNSICKLYQLQTLRLLQCHKLKKLPKKLYKLVNLRHIEIRCRDIYPIPKVYASQGLRKLTCLQTLPDLKLRDGKGWSIDELGPLDQVKGDMRISGLNCVKKKEEAIGASLWRKDKILTLKLTWGGSSKGHNDEDVLDSLEPHPNIQSLEIEGFNGVKFPRWIRTMSVKQSGHQTQLRHLTKVELRGCRRCQQLPSFGQLPKLTWLKLVGFDKVEKIGDEFYYENMSNIISDRNVLFPALRGLSFSSFNNLITWMPPSPALGTSCFPVLEFLQIEEGCSRLETLPSLPLKSLKSIWLWDFGGNQSLDIIKGSPGLELLEIGNSIKEMERLPEEVANCRNLQKLCIYGCEKLKGIPSGMISLEELNIWDCPSLESVGDMRGLSSLRLLTINRCWGLKSMPKSLEDCTSLKELTIVDCPSIEVVEEDTVPDISKLRSLTELTLLKAGGLEAYLPQWIPHLHGLTRLEIGGGCRAEEWDMSLTSNLTSLTKLILDGFPNLEPLQHLLPPSLQTLGIINFEDMEAVPEWIGDLSSLRKLYLRECNKLKYLPSKQAILRLTSLDIMGCPELEKRCDKHYNGPDSQWPNISHLPEIYINGDEVSQ